MKKIKKPNQILCLLFFALCSQAMAQRDSLDIKIGQMILIGTPKAEIDTIVLEAVNQGKVGSLIYFEKNIPKSPSAFAAFKKMSWTYQKAATIPLFISIDQEGGKVNRLKEKYGFARSITAEAIGKSKSIDSVRFYAESTAATLAGLGINVNFAPCVDLAVNRDNTVIVKNGRSYSANADSVTLFAKEVIKQHRRFGIVTSLKHFPGHGSSKEDTHLGIADVTKTWTPIELKPYQDLIDNGYVDAVMSSHIVNKKLDRSALPGTLSKAVLDSVLRKKMQYNGVVFSDDMQMKAIASNYGFAEALKMAINAGIDIVCVSNNVPKQERHSPDTIHLIIKNFVVNGQIPKSRIDESFKRIMKLKQMIQRSEVETLKHENEQLAKLSKLQSEQLKKANEEIEKLTPKKKKKKRAKK